MRRIRGAIAGLLLAFAAVPAWADSVTVFAAASLQGSLDEVVKAFRESTGNDVRVSYGPSGALARQVERGAPADVFVSADEDWAKYLEGKSLLAGPPKGILANDLVLIAPAASTVQVKLAPGVDLAPLLGGKRLVIANPNVAPAGRYAKAALASLGAWDSIAKSVGAAANVRGALALVARGEAPLGVVYRTDALAEPKVKIVDTFPASSHPPIVYPVANVARLSPPAAFDFADYLASPAARAIFQRFGFRTLP